MTQLRPIAVLAVLLIAGCSTDDTVSGGGLLNLDNPPVDPSSATLRVIGPNNTGSGGVSVTAGCSQTGFIAEFLDGNGKGIANAFVRIVSDLGTVRSADGRSTGGATTDAQGRARFTYIAPSDVLGSDIDTLQPTSGIDDTPVQGDPFEVQLSAGPAPTLTLLGPGGVASGNLAVPADTLVAGFTAQVRPGASCQPREGHTVNFTVTQGRIDAPSGNVATFSGKTNASGLLDFDYLTPDFVTRPTDFTIKATTSVSRQSATANYVVRVLPPQISLSGPDQAFPADTRQGYRLRLTKADGTPIPGEQVTITASQGTIRHQRTTANQPAFTTDSAGEIRFSYTPPAGIDRQTLATITAESQDLGVSADLLVTIEPDQIQLSGPSDAFPGERRTGFVVKLTRADGRTIPGARVEITAGQGTIEHIRSSSSPGNFRTDDFGEIAFAYTPPAGIVQTTNVTITATATDSAIATDTIVTVRPHSFRFTAPEPNSAVLVGVDNAQPLSFSWTTAGGSGVVGDVVLTSSSTNARFLVNTDVESRGVRSVTVRTNSAGNFSQPVSIFSNFSEFVTITATDASNGQQIAKLPIQFVDTPGTNPDSAILTVTPARINASLNPDATAELLFRVTNDANEPIDGLDVVFRIVGGSTHPNEEIFPIGGTTRQGEARSTYYPRPGTGTPQDVLLEACLADNSLCDTYLITVE